MILRPTLMDTKHGDPLGLVRSFKAALRQRQAGRSRSGEDSSNSLVFIDADYLPGACTPRGQYRVKGNDVSVDLVLFLQEAEGVEVAKGEWTVTGTTGDLDKLVEQLVSTVSQACPSD